MSQQKNWTDSWFHENGSLVGVREELGHQEAPPSLSVLNLRADPGGRRRPNALRDRTSEARPLGLDAEALHSVDDFIVEVRAAIRDQVFGCRIERKRLAQLLNNPRAGWMPGHVEVKNTTSIMCYHKEAVENSERERRHGKEIHGGDRFTMATQKSGPSLCRLGSPRRFPHPAKHRSLRNVEAKHFQFSMNP